MLTSFEQSQNVFGLDWLTMQTILIRLCIYSTTNKKAASSIASPASTMY